MLLLALAGKPNCGKSTFFKSLTLANVEIANYPFTTIDANKGVAYVRSPCPCKELGLDNCTSCVDGVRFIPVELLDVAGLVPDAHLGRGLGNQFLDNLREADGIIQVVDASGSTDAEGNPVDIGTRDPREDVEFLRYEFAMWMAGIVDKHLAKLVRQAQGKEAVLIDLLAGALAGLRINAIQIREAVDETGINLAKATPEEIEQMCEVLLRVSNPMIIAANKADQAAEATLRALSGRTHKVLTGDTLRTVTNEESFCCATRVTFLPIDPQDIRYYVSRFSPLYKAGAYAIQEWIGETHIASIEGSYHNVVGLPTAQLYQRLKKFAVRG